LISLELQGSRNPLTHKPRVHRPPLLPPNPGGCVETPAPVTGVPRS